MSISGTKSPLVFHLKFQDQVTAGVTILGMHT